MIKKIAFFDLDGTLWNIHSDIWVIDKEKPYKPVIKIPSLEFSLIKNGIYQKDNLPLNYNGQRFYISKEIFNRIYKKTRSENINRFGISFNNFYNKKILNKSKIEYLLNNIEHLRGKKDINIGLLTARSNRTTHSDVINNLRLKLKDMEISLNKIYFIGDKFKVYYDENSSLKKVYILLEHLIGFKIKNNKFVSLRQDWYPEVHFYDDYKGNIEYANDVQKILNDLVKNTDDDLLNIIIERINTNNIRLYNNLITNNNVNKFDTNVINIKEPDKFPIFEKKIETYDNFQIDEIYVYHDNYYKSDKVIKKEMNTEIKNILNSFIMKYVFDYRITNFIINYSNNNTKIDITIFGFGGALNNGHNSHDALLKLIFEKKKDKWQVSYKKSKVFIKMQNEITDYKMKNITKIRMKIFNYLNNLKK